MNAVRILLVRTHISGFQTENPRLRVLLLPVLPGGFDQGKGLESCPGFGTGDRLGENLRPETSRLLIVKQNVGSVQLARNTKRVTLTIE
jgi:hypothetical protein